MCRGATFCSELGVDPSQWSLNTPLAFPEVFNTTHTLFISAYEAAIAGDLELAKSLLNKTIERGIRDWYVEHGQMSGFFRFKALGNMPAPKYLGELDPLTSITQFETQVYDHDAYRCAYCSNPLIHSKELKNLEKLLGPDNFRTSGTNVQRHGFIFILRATLDHVVPLSHGGRTELSNLVTSCWSCNYGKSNYTLAEIGLNDPRLNRDTKESD